MVRGANAVGLAPTVQPWYAIALFEGTLGSDGTQTVAPVDITNLNPISLNTELLVYVKRSK